ncbi:hypothetical protein SeMB42_g01132 [Synchytrium endobioticum]|uniref:Uncharacterized protein n=1 Tax=Synchytrium endobioticum TaxID=286115 RepID=A0A507DN32_9FUNG|nr:hypothetical protein SeMB42_g01132 [Synchytrium endobioticum]
MLVVPVHIEAISIHRVFKDGHWLSGVMFRMGSGMGLEWGLLNPVQSSPGTSMGRAYTVVHGQTMSGQHSTAQHSIPYHTMPCHAMP